MLSCFHVCPFSSFVFLYIPIFFLSFWFIFHFILPEKLTYILHKWKSESFSLFYHISIWYQYLLYHATRSGIVHQKSMNAKNGTFKITLQWHFTYTPKRTHHQSRCLENANIESTKSTKSTNASRFFFCQTDHFCHSCRARTIDKFRFTLHFVDRWQALNHLHMALGPNESMTSGV